MKLLEIYLVLFYQVCVFANGKLKDVINSFQVKDRTSNYNSYNAGSHVMEYGSTDFKDERLSLYQGFDPATKIFPPNKILFDKHMEVVNQRDADLLFMWHRVSLIFLIKA